MRNKSKNAPVSKEPTDDDVRGYAYHLYIQGGCASGHDVGRLAGGEGLPKREHSSTGNQNSPPSLRDQAGDELDSMQTCYQSIANAALSPNGALAPCVAGFAQT